MKNITKKQIIEHLRYFNNLITYHRKKDLRAMETDGIIFGVQFGVGIIFMILSFFAKIFFLPAISVFFITAIGSGIKLMHFFPYTKKELDKLMKATNGKKRSNK